MNHQFLTELDELLDQHGMTREINGARIIITDTQSEEAINRQSLQLYGNRFGLEADDYGAEFVCGGERFKLVGCKLGRPKYPLLGESLQSGKVYKIPLGVVSQIQRGRATRVQQQPTQSAPTNMGGGSSTSNASSNSADYADAGIF